MQGSVSNKAVNCEYEKCYFKSYSFEIAIVNTAFIVPRKREFIIGNYVIFNLCTIMYKKKDLKKDATPAS